MDDYNFGLFPFFSRFSVSVFSVSVLLVHPIWMDCSSCSFCLQPFAWSRLFCSLSLVLCLKLSSNLVALNLWLFHRFLIAFTFSFVLFFSCLSLSLLSLLVSCNVSLFLVFRDSTWACFCLFYSSLFSPSPPTSCTLCPDFFLYFFISLLYVLSFSLINSFISFSFFLPSSCSFTSFFSFLSSFLSSFSITLTRSFNVSHPILASVLQSQWISFWFVISDCFFFSAFHEYNENRLLVPEVDRSQSPGDCISWRVSFDSLSLWSSGRIVILP